MTRLPTSQTERLWSDLWWRNLVDAGAFDSLISDRRSALQEVGLRYHSRREQPTLDLPVEQDLLDLHRQTEWDRMEGEYRTMGLYPSGHAMAHMRWHLGEHVMPSNIMHKFPDGAEVTTAGLVIRRQHPMTDAVFVTLEDEFGHIPLIVWPGVYNRYRDQLREPFVLVSGRVTRRDGTFQHHSDRDKRCTRQSTPTRIEELALAGSLTPLSYSPGIEISEQRSEHQVESYRRAKLPKGGITGKEIVDQRGRCRDQAGNRQP